MFYLEFKFRIPISKEELLRLKEVVNISSAEIQVNFTNDDPDYKDDDFPYEENGFGRITRIKTFGYNDFYYGHHHHNPVSNQTEDEIDTELSSSWGLHCQRFMKLYLLCQKHFNVE